MYVHCSLYSFDMRNLSRAACVHMDHVLSGWYCRILQLSVLHVIFTCAQFFSVFSVFLFFFSYVLLDWVLQKTTIENDWSRFCCKPYASLPHNLQCRIIEKKYTALNPSKKNHLLASSFLDSLTCCSRKLQHTININIIQCFVQHTHTNI